MADQPHNRRKWLIASAVGVLLLSAAAWAGLEIINSKDVEQGRLCQGLDAVSEPGFQLHKVEEQCIGWTVDRDHAFGSEDKRVPQVISRIIQENRRVHREAENYVRIAVMLPMTSASKKSALLADSIHEALQGAYAAQRQANAKTSPLGDPGLQIQLVLANQGADQRNWDDEFVVPALGALKNDPHPLVAVTGMGISIPETPKAATRLNELGLPSIGAVLTADDMRAPGLFKVSPSNHHYAQALQAFLNHQESLPKPLSSYLVFDRNPDDNYVQSLYAAFMDTFGSALSDRSRGFDGSRSDKTTLFEPHVNDICHLEPQVVFYAGRDRDLQALLDALRYRKRCTKGGLKPLLIATGSTGLNISSAGLEEAELGILDASATDPQGWQSSTEKPEHYADFHALFTGDLQFQESDLNSGYAIMHRDAVAAAIRAARSHFSASVSASPAGQPGAALPTAADVRNSLFSIGEDPLPGASGRFHFREKPQNDLWPIGKPVPVLRLGSVATKLSPVDDFPTGCQILKHPDTPHTYETIPCPL